MRGRVIALAAVLAGVAVALGAATPGRAGPTICDGMLEEWQAKRALGVPGGVRVTVSSDQGKGSLRCTWAYSTRSASKALLLQSRDFRFTTTGRDARDAIAGELCRYKIACGSKLRAFKSAANGSRAFKELAKAFVAAGKARNVSVASGSPAFVAVSAGQLTGGAYALRNGWLDVFACIDMRSYETDADCSVRALQYADS